MACENVGQIVELLEGIYLLLLVLGVSIGVLMIAMLFKGYTIYPQDKG